MEWYMQVTVKLNLNHIDLKYRFIKTAQLSSTVKLRLFVYLERG